MEDPLLLPSSTIFEGSNSIDKIRQTFIDLGSSPEEEDVQSFLENSIKYLSSDIDMKTANELFTTISSCFSHYPKQLIPVFTDFLKNSKSHSNYIILTSYILFELTRVQPPLDLPDYHSFVNDALKEILPQIQNSDSNDLTIFDHTIPSNFAIKFLFNLLLSSNLTNQLISDFFLYIIFHPEFDLIAEKISNSNFYKILTQTADSNNELFEFINGNDFSTFSKLNDESKSLIECAIVFTKSDAKSEISIEGLNKETVLQFTAIASIYLKESRSQSKQKINDLLIDGLNYSKNNNLPILNESINQLLYDFVLNLNNELIQKSTMFQFLEFLINEDPFRSEIKKYLFMTIFELAGRDTNEDIVNFFKANGSKILQILIENLNEVNKSDLLEKIKLNLSVFDTSVLMNHLQECSSLEEAKESIYFIERVCLNVPPIQNSEDLTAILLLFFNEIIQEGSWDDVLLIGNFMKKNGNFDEIQEFRNEETMPVHVKESLFGYVISEQDKVDELLEKILNDANAEKKEKSFSYLFDRMIDDKEMRHFYLVYIVNRYRDHNLKIDSFLTVFSADILRFKDDFIDVINEVYYYNENERIFIKKPGFKLNSLQIPEFGLSIVTKLFDKIENKKQVFQSFLCLKFIATSFPFLFGRDPQKVFDIVLPILDDYFLLFNPYPNDEEFQKIKTIYCAFSFLLSTLQSTIVLDQFLDWLFTKITTFSDSQVVALLIILRLINGENDVKTYINAFIWKHNFFEKLGNILSRCSNQNDLIKSITQLNVFDLIEEILENYPKFTKHELILIDDLMKEEKPLERYFDDFLYTFPCTYLFATIKFSSFSERLLNFMKFMNKIKPNDLCSGILNDHKDQLNSVQVNYFISKLEKCNDIVNSEILPNFDGPLTIRMVKYLLKQPIFIYSHIFVGKKLSVPPEMFEQLLVAIEEISSMKNKPKESQDEEDREAKSIDINDFLLQHICQQGLLTNILDSVYDGGIEKQDYITLIKVFDHFSKNDFAYISFLSLFSDFLKKKHSQNIGREFNVNFLSGIYNLIDFLIDLPKTNAFLDSFDYTCGDESLDICLSPICRNDSALLLIISSLLLLVSNENFSDRVTHLVSFLFLTKNEKLVEAGLKLSCNFTLKQLEIVESFILDRLDDEINKDNISEMFINFMKRFPSFFAAKYYQLFNFLSFQLEKYTKSSPNDNVLFDKICFLLNFLAPKRDNSNSFSSAVEKSSIIPQFIMETSPQFWQLFEKYNESIISKIKNEPILLNKMKFLLNYPELVSFDIRSSYFRKEMKSQIDSNNKLTINVQSDNLLESSFEFLKNQPDDLLYQQFNVVFDNSKTVDHGGVTSDWFTKLSKEIFNQKNGYFQCVGKCMSYQPNILSINKNDYLKFFRFAGQFVARALIEGICIDAHLTTPFIKQILHRKLKLNDLETIDFELFQSMNWILENDVDALEMKFEVYDESGTNSTIPLKENGTEIQVTNKNKNEYVNLMYNYHLKKKIEKQIDAFVDGFDSLIPHFDVSYFTPNELDLLICGVPEIDVEDFKANTVFQEPYNKDSPVIKYFFNVISRWENDQLIKLLSFMTGRSRVSANGFKEFCEISGMPLTINSGGDRSLLPQAHTCVNTLSLPQYESEEELEEKLKKAINLCDSFEII